MRIIMRHDHTSTSSVKILCKSYTTLYGGVQGVNEEPLMETRGKGDRGRREKKKKKLTPEEKEDREVNKKKKGRTNFARDYSVRCLFLNQRSQSHSL